MDIVTRVKGDDTVMTMTLVYCKCATFDHGCKKPGKKSSAFIDLSASVWGLTSSATKIYISRKFFYLLRLGLHCE